MRPFRSGLWARTMAAVMESTARWTLVFALALALFLLVPPFLSTPFPPYPSINWQEAVDLFTPLVLIPLYWALFRTGVDTTTWPERLAFLLLAALWVEGQGMHLAANSIGHLVEGQPGATAELTHFYDEVLSHYLWHVGVVGLAALAIYRQWRHPFAGERSSLRAETLGGLFYGLTYFAIAVEGQTAPLMLPAALLVVLAPSAGLAWRRRSLREMPVIAFFLIGTAVALILFAAWWARWGGLPEFSDPRVGIL